MTVNVTSLASKLELIVEVSARYMHESINQSETGFELVILFPFSRETVAVCQVFGRVVFLGGGFLFCFFFRFVSCLFWGFCGGFLVGFLFVFVFPYTFALTVLTLAMEINDIKLLCDSLNTIHGKK